jgi:hypothetical protein
MIRSLPAPIEGSVEHGRLGRAQAFRLEAPLRYQGYQHDRCVHGWTTATNGGTGAWALFVDLSGSTPVASGIRLGTTDEASLYAEQTYGSCTSACCVGAGDPRPQSQHIGWVRFEGPGKLHAKRWHQVRTSNLGAVTLCGVRLRTEDEWVPDPGIGLRCSSCARAAQLRS